MKISWGWRIAIVYTFFAVSTAAFVAFAMTENVELVRSDYYEQSLKHDETFAAEERGKAIDLSLTQDGESVTIGLPASHADLTAGSVLFYRPENSKFDHSFPLTGTTTEVPVNKIQPGHYEVSIEWTFEGKRFRVLRNLSVGGVR